MQNQIDFQSQSFTVGDKVYILSQQSKNLFIIKENIKTIRICATQAEAIKQFEDLKFEKKGGEDMKKDSEVVTKKDELALPEKYFKDNEMVGLSTLGVEDVPIPGLSIIQSTSKVRDDEGRPYAPGMMYYKALKLAMQTVECSILVISKKDMPSYIDKAKMERTFIVLGALKNDVSYMPFVFYAKGSAYFAVRTFIGEVKARKYPMYALTVQLSTEKRQNDQGEWFVPVFKITGVHTDPETIVSLENLAKEYDRNPQEIHSEEEVGSEEVNLDDLPFS